jgi:hypothetical protein
MTLFLVAFQDRSNKGPIPPYAHDALECARRFSGCRVVALAEVPEPGWDDAAPYLHSAKRAGDYIKTYCDQNNAIKSHNDYGVLPFMQRWFVIHEYIKATRLAGPIFNCDWDMLVFQNLDEHFRKLNGPRFDYGHFIDYDNVETGRTAPGPVYNHASIAFFCEVMTSLCKYRPRYQCIHSGDMWWWNAICEMGRYQGFDAGIETDGAVFDSNIHRGEGRYEFQGGAKQILFRNKSPYFIRKHDDCPVKAVGIHCFMSWKKRTGELMEHV